MEIYVQGLPEKCEARPEDVKQIVRFVLTKEDVDCELAVIFVDDAAMSDLNHKYTKRKGTTDVLAFSMREGTDSEYSGHVLGDVFVSIDRAREQAKELGHTFRRELLFLVLHGLLHLLGYDHKSMPKKIESLEEELATLLTIDKSRFRRKM